MDLFLHFNCHIYVVSVEKMGQKKRSEKEKGNMGSRVVTSCWMNFMRS